MNIPVFEIHFSKKKKLRLYCWMKMYEKLMSIVG